MPNFFQELKRRRVIRVAAVYFIAAWAVIQGAGTLVQLLDLPLWTGKLVFALVVVGFPIAMALAWAFDITPDGVERTAPSSTPLLGRRSAWFVIGILVAFSGAFYAYTRRAPDVALDANVVAVLPFRVTTADASLGYLSEGMVDLLGAKLSGQGGPRALDPRAVISAIRQTGANANELDPQASLEVARGLGAGLLLRGEIVGSPKHVTLSAALIDARTGAEKARQSVEGSPDSLSVLVDRLTGQLLARGAGVPEDQIAKLAYVPLPAVQSYLAGQSKYRHGEYEAAQKLFARALQVDSMFVAVLPAYVAALEWAGNLNDAVPHIRRLAPVLNERDRALIAMFQPDAFDAEISPTPRSGDFARRALEAAEKAERLAPDHPEVYYVAGDVRFHYPFPHNPTKDLDVAAAWFNRALDLDSTFAPALGHMVEIAALRRDTAEVRRYSTRYLAADSAGDLADHTRWIAAHALGDSVQSRALRSSYRTTSPQNLVRILGSAQFGGLALAEADLVQEEMLRRRDREYFWVAYQYGITRGREDWIERALSNSPREAQEGLAVAFALLGDGDTERADRMVRDIDRAAKDAVKGPATRDRGLQMYRRFMVTFWRLAHGEPTEINEIVEGVRQFSAADAALLEAMHAQQRRSPDARARLAKLDSILFSGAQAPDTQLAAARLHEQQGDLEGALKLLRGSPRHWGLISYLPTYLKEEGRIAARIGDREGAIRAYTQYLELRSNPSPRFVPERNWVRAELAKLSRDR